MNIARTELGKVASISAAATIVVFAGLLLVFKTPGDILFNVMLNCGLALTVTGVFWSFYERIGWRVRPLRLFGWLSPLPDLNGRWVGTVCRSQNDEPRPFVMEITQTYSRIAFVTFSEHSQGASQAAWLMTNEDKNTFGAVAVWQTTDKRLYHSALEETFTGTSNWRVEFTDNPGDLNDRIKIVDRYYTARTPPTAGTVEVRRVSRKLRNSFE